MYLKGSKWSMNRRRQHFNWFRIIVLTLLIAAGLYMDKFIIPTAPGLFDATPTATRPPEAYMTEGQALFDQGKLNQAIQVYEQAVAVKPDDPAIYVALAQVQVFAGDYKGAQASAENALLLNPNNSMAHAVRAWVLDFQGNPLEAEAEIKRALELDPNNAMAHAFYVEILVDEGPGTVLKAVDESKVAQALAPDSLLTHRARGYVLNATGNYEEAAREYQAAIAINKNIPDLHLQLGKNYRALGINDQAVQEFTNANALNPANPEPDYLTSRTYATIGEFAKARQYAETAVKDDPTSARYHGNLGVMYYHTALFTDAAKELGLAVNGGITAAGEQVQSMELVPSDARIAEIYFTYALVLSKLGRCGETLQVAQTVQARIPTDDISITNVNAAIQTCQAQLGGSSTLIPLPLSAPGTALAAPSRVIPALTPTP